MPHNGKLWDNVDLSIRKLQRTCPSLAGTFKWTRYTGTLSQKSPFITGIDRFERTRRVRISIPFNLARLCKSEFILETANNNTIAFARISLPAHFFAFHCSALCSTQHRSIALFLRSFTAPIIMLLSEYDSKYMPLIWLLCLRCVHFRFLIR